MLRDALLATIFDTSDHAFKPVLAAWLASSRRYSAFVEVYQAKIRKKLRTVTTPDSLGGLQMELETAYLLLREPTLSLAYETEHRSSGRSPDFAVSYTSSFTFMAEVTRLRSLGMRDAAPFNDRFADMLCDKLGQSLAQRANVLIVGVEEGGMTHDALTAAVQRVRLRAESNDASVLQRHGFRDRADFFQHFGSMSAILVRAVPLAPGAVAAFWSNPLARHPLPAKARTALLRSHAV